MSTTTMRLLTIAAAMLLATACQQGPNEVPTLPENNEGQQTTDTSSRNDTDVMPEPDPTKGPDEDEVLIDVGFMSGTWRVGEDTPDNQPVVYFSFIQDEGDPIIDEIASSFEMSIALGSELDGNVGKITSARYEGDSLTVAWNPTNDEQQLFTITAQKVDEKTLRGTLVDVDRAVDMQIVLTRDDPEPNSGVLPNPEEGM